MSVRIPRVFTPQQALRAGESVELSAEASHHLIKVLRMLAGREIKVFNGDGNEYSGQIEHVSKKTATVFIQDCCFKPNTSALDTRLAIALSKGDRFDWVIQKATELGVDEIIPLFSERCEIKLSGERLEKKMLSWQKVIIAACEQCQRNTLPKLSTPCDISEYTNTCSSELKFVLHHRTEQSLESITAPKSVSFLIGPEGGLSGREIVEAVDRGFLPLAFGSRVLRTETAPITALSIAQYLWGDLGTLANTD